MTLDQRPDCDASDEGDDQDGSDDADNEARLLLWRPRGARGALKLTLSIVALLSLLTVALRLTVAARDGHLLSLLLAVAACDGHLLSLLLTIAACDRHLLGGLLSITALLGVSTLLGLVRLLILRRIGRAHHVLPCW